MKRRTLARFRARRPEPGAASTSPPTRRTPKRAGASPRTRTRPRTNSVSTSASKSTPTSTAAPASASKRRTSATRSARRTRPRPEANPHHHNVYVVLLDPAIRRFRSVQRANPNARPDLPCVYVGMTGLSPEERFENHREGHKSAWAVRRFGLRLLPELFAHLNPMPFDAATAMERDLAEDLRLAGYTVTGGH